MVVEERLDLRVSPAAELLAEHEEIWDRYSRIKDPVLHIAVSIRSLFRGLGPGLLYLAHEAVLAGGGAVLCGLALSRKVALELGSVPGVVGTSDIVLPLALDEIKKVLAVGRGGVGDIVV